MEHEKENVARHFHTCYRDVKKWGQRRWTHKVYQSMATGRPPHMRREPGPGLSGVRHASVPKQIGALGENITLGCFRV